MKVKTRKISKRYICALAFCGALILFLMTVLTGCGKDVKEEDTSFFMKNHNGTYNLLEVEVPEGKGPHPVVMMAHGFAGTLHSGGARELAKRLSEKGMIAVMIDFNRFEKPEMDAERTRSYPLFQMEDDMVLAIDEVIKRFDGDPDDISLYGRSYGGRLMMRMANESSGGHEYRKLALVAPAGDDICFYRYLGGRKRYEEMKREANKGGYSEKLGVKVTPEWFHDVETYDPTKYGKKFGDRPVLLFYNTKDTVVYPDTSIRCAKAYKNHEIIKVTTDDGHGYEMGFKKSELKDEIMDKLVEFLAK